MARTTASEIIRCDMTFRCTSSRCRLVGMHGRKRIWLAAIVLSGSLTACGESMSNDQRKGALAAYAQTALGEGQPGAKRLSKAEQAEQDAKVQALLEKRRAEKEAALAAQLAALAVLPAEKPKTMVKACDALLDAYHSFQLSTREGDDKAILEWYSRKKNVLGKRRLRCMQLDSIDAAACQTHALQNAPATLAEHEQTLLQTCAKKFAPEAFARMEREGNKRG